MFSISYPCVNKQISYTGRLTNKKFKKYIRLPDVKSRNYDASLLRSPGKLNSLRKVAFATDVPKLTVYKNVKNSFINIILCMVFRE